MLDRKLQIPLYEQLKNKIKEKIESGELKPNDKLPSERELGERYQVSRITVRQAIALAEREGLVLRVHGVGTFVSAPKIKQELHTIDNFQSSVQQLGLIASTTIYKYHSFPADLHYSKLLDIPLFQQVRNLQLIGYGDSSPIVYYNTYFPDELGERIIESAKNIAEKGKPFSTLDLYEFHEDFFPTHSEQTFESIVTNEELAEILQVKAGFPVLKATSLIYQNDTPLEYKEAYYRGDKYKFSIIRPITN